MAQVLRIRDFQDQQTQASRTEKPHVHKPRQREREFLRPDEARRLIEAAGKCGRQGERDKALVKLIYRHGLRCSEAVGARWADFNLEIGHDACTFYVRRLKGSQSTTHTLERDEANGLRRLQAASGGSLYVFVSEQGNPLSPDMVARVIQRAGEKAGIPFRVWPHLLRHSAGYALANGGTDLRLIQAYLGHQNVQNTTRYAALAPATLARVRVR